MSQRGIVRAAFDQGQKPTIACINSATEPLGVDFPALVRALQRYVSDHFAPVWGTPAKLVRAKDFLPGAWALVFLDRADVQDALGYHDLTPDGLPLAKVFVKTTLEIGDLVSVTASHEVAEMLVDPAVNLWADAPGNVLWAYEMADAVEDVSFNVNGIAMSDFVFPAYFEMFRKPHSTRFDYCRKVTRPFQLLPNGYTIERKGASIHYVYGSKAKERKMAREDREEHRSEYRQKRVTPSRRSRILPRGGRFLITAA